MVIKTITVVVCDTCGKEADEYKIKGDNKSSSDNIWGYSSISYLTYRPSDTDTPFGWYTLDQTKVRHRANNDHKTIKNKNIFSCGDPHFCSKKCLMDWLTKKINKI